MPSSQHMVGMAFTATPEVLIPSCISKTPLGPLSI
jgi:hypothetical protein